MGWLGYIFFFALAAWSAEFSCSMLQLVVGCWQNWSKALAYAYPYSVLSHPDLLPYWRNQRADLWHLFYTIIPIIGGCWEVMVYSGGRNGKGGAGRERRSFSRCAAFLVLLQTSCMVRGQISLMQVAPKWPMLLPLFIHLRHRLQIRYS